jgi:uncharacterized protein YuzE
MKLQPIQLFPMPMAAGSSAPSGMQGVGGFSDLMDSPGEPSLANWLLAQSKPPSVGRDPTLSPDSQGRPPAVLDLPATLLVETLEESAVPVALVTDIPPEALAYGGEPPSPLMDLLDQQPDAWAGSLPNLALAIDEAQDEPALLSFVPALAPAIVPAPESTPSRPSRPDLTSNTRAPVAQVPTSKEAPRTTPTASSTKLADAPPQPALDEVITRSPLREQYTPRADAFQRPAHEPAPKVEVNTGLAAQTEVQVARQVPGALPGTTVDQIDRDAEAESDSSTEASTKEETTSIRPVDAQRAHRPKPIQERLAKIMDENLDSPGLVLETDEWGEDIEVDLAAEALTESEQATPEGHLPSLTDVVVDVDEDLAVKISTNGREVAVSLEGTASALDDLRDVGPELAESLRNLGFDLSEFSSEEREAAEEKEDTGSTGQTAASTESEQTDRPRVRRGHRVDLLA